MRKELKTRFIQILEAWSTMLEARIEGRDYDAIRNVSILPADFEKMKADIAWWKSQRSKLPKEEAEWDEFFIEFQVERHLVRGRKLKRFAYEALCSSIGSRLWGLRQPDPEPVRRPEPQEDTGTGCPHAVYVPGCVDSIYASEGEVQGYFGVDDGHGNVSGNFDTYREAQEEARARIPDPW